MHNDEAPLQRIRRLRGFGALMVAVALVLCLHWAPVAAVSSFGESVTVGAIGLFAAVQFWLARRTPPEARVGARIWDPNALPSSARGQVFRRQLLLGAVIFPVLSIWTAYDLNSRDAGVIPTASLWMPIRIVYAQLGYWPAMLVAPALGVTFCAILAFRLRQLARNAHDNGAD